MKWLPIAAFAVLLVDASCGQPSVGFDVVLPSSIAQQTAWIELGVYPGACPSKQELMGGVPTAGVVARVAFQNGDTAPPAIGSLPSGNYAFAAVARAADCTVLGGGCTVADVTKSSTIQVDVGAASSGGGGACGAASRCEDGLCVPNDDNGNPALGAGCSLALVGAGPLGDPLTIGSTTTSDPAIAVTDSGFLVAYREYDPNQGIGRLTLIPIDTGGGAGAPQRTTLPGQCAGATENDSASLVYVTGQGGTVVLARPPCGSMAGFDVFQTDATGAVTMSGFDGVGAAGLTLANAHALAAAPAGGSFLLAFDESDQAELATVQGLMTGNGASGFGGVAPVTAGWVATTSQLVALLAVGPGGTPPPDGDGGVSDETGSPEGEGSLRLNVVAANADLGSLPPPFVFGGTLGSVTAQGTRAYVVSDGSTADMPVVWQAFDLGTQAPVARGGFAPDGLGPVLYADVALAGDRAIFAVEQPGSITVSAYDKAVSTTQPVPLETVFLPSLARIPSLANVTDGHIAVAASATRVAVVWTTATNLAQNDDVGGYAVFACTTP